MTAIDLKHKYQAIPSQLKAFDMWFLRYLPTNLEYAIEKRDLFKNKESYEEFALMCENIDMVDFQYRRYVSGLTNSLNRLIFEVERLRRCKLYQPEQLKEIMFAVEQNIIQNELYELMNSHKKAKQMISLLYSI